MMKRFCTNCGTLLFGNSSGRKNVVSIRAGTIDQTDFVEPVMNVFIDSKIRLTPIDSNFRQASEMREDQPWIKD